MNGSRGFVNAIRGPVTLITMGVLFALNNFTQYGFDRTWPVLLIVFGLLSLLRRGLEPAPPPPVAYPPPYAPYPQQSGYSQSTYSQPAPPPAPSTEKGGFGGSASGAPPKGDTV